MNFSQILQAMVTSLQNAKSKLTDFTQTSVIYQILSAVASIVDQIYYSITNAQNQAYVKTASGSGLDAKGADLKVPRKQPTNSQWIFTFTKNTVSTQQINIPAGTLITTIPQQGQSPITFATGIASYLPAGSTNVNIPATCSQAGSIGNISTQIPLLVGSPVTGIDGVQLNSLTGGIYGTDTEGDEPYRSRLLNALASKAQGTVAWYQSTATSVTGVQSATVYPLNRGGGTVDIYIVGTNNSIPSSTLIGQVQAAIDAGRIITDDAKVFGPTLYTVNETITIKVDPNYDVAATGTAVQTAITNFINNLSIGGGTVGALYQSKVLAVALGVAGVLNATTTNTDITFTTFQLPQAGTITVNASH
jgi:uncharacterized phage protein gp47/JayE